MEGACEQRLREFSAGVDDDDEVRGLFEKQASERLRQAGLVISRLQDWGGAPDRSEVSSTLSPTPKVFQRGDALEERLVQNLMISYAAERGLCGLYELLAAASEFESDVATMNLAVQLRGEHENSAQELYHMLPSRTKIAFNMLTVSEVDPSVETKLADDRLVGS